MSAGLEAKNAIPQPNRYLLPNSCMDRLHLYTHSDKEPIIVQKEAVLPVMPLIDIVPSLSIQTRTLRRVIYQVENFDVISAF